MDDPLVSFDSPVETTTKDKSIIDFSPDNDDPFADHNGNDSFSLNHNDLFPVDIPENQKGFLLHSFNFDGHSYLILVVSTGEEKNESSNNGNVTDDDKLLFDLDPNAPSQSTEPVHDNNSLLDIDNSNELTTDFTSFHNPAYQLKGTSSPSNESEQQSTSIIVDQVVQELTEKVESTASPPKKPVSATKTKPSNATKPKPSSAKPTTKPTLSSRKTIHTVPVKAKPTSPTQDASRPTVNSLIDHFIELFRLISA